MDSKIAVKGMFRVHICNEDGTLAGDSGWKKNLVTDVGFNEFIVKGIGTNLTGQKISHVGLGTGGAAVSSSTSLAGEVGTRQAVTAATSAGSQTLNCVATFASGWYTVTDAAALSNIGLFNSSSGGSFFAGAAYASSSCASNQAVNVTYNIVFETA